MTRRYVTAKRLAHLEETLAPREKAIISTLDRLRVATTEQLRRIHFHDLTPRSAARQTPALLASLAARQVVVRLERQVGGVRAGSRAAVWSLDVAGQKLASACGPAGGRKPRRPWTPSLSFLAHRLAVSDCFAGLMEQHQAKERSERPRPGLNGSEQALRGQPKGCRSPTGYWRTHPAPMARLTLSAVSASIRSFSRSCAFRPTGSWALS